MIGTVTIKRNMFLKTAWACLMAWLTGVEVIEVANVKISMRMKA